MPTLTTSMAKKVAAIGVPKSAEKQALIKADKIKKSKHESTIVTLDKIPYEIIDGKERCIAHEVPFEIPDTWEWVRIETD